METTRKNWLKQEDAEYLKPAKLGQKRLAQIYKIREQEGCTGPFSTEISSQGLKYVALDWRFNDHETVEPMLSFFTDLPKRYYSSPESLGTGSFIKWLPLPTKWLCSWKRDKAYKLQGIFLEDEELEKIKGGKE